MHDLLQALLLTYIFIYTLKSYFDKILIIAYLLITYKHTVLNHRIFLYTYLLISFITIENIFYQNTWLVIKK